MGLAAGTIEIGDQFGSWTVIDEGPLKGRNRYYLCRCACGPSVPSAAVHSFPVRAPTAAVGRTEAEIFTISLHKIYYGKLSA